MGRQSKKKTTFKLGETDSALLFGKDRIDIILPFEQDGSYEEELDKELPDVAWTNVLIATAIASLIREDDEKFVGMINDRMDKIIQQMAELDTKSKEIDE